MRAHRLVAVAVAGLLTLGACGDDTTSSDTTQPAVCTAREDLKTAVTDLGEVNVLKDGTDALRQYVDQVQDALDSLRAAAKDEYQEETTAVEDALDQVRTALEGGVSVDALREAASAVGDLATSLSNLVSAIEEAC